jgi:putative hemolysin
MDRRDRSQVSYAKSAHSRSGQAVIKLIENATGRLHLIQRARDYDAEIAQGRSFWEVMVNRYGLSLDVVSGAIADIPAEGPLVVVANHPFGILDGLIMGYLLSTRRGDFRILANRRGKAELADPRQGLGFSKGRWRDWRLSRRDRIDRGKTVPAAT